MAMKGGKYLFNYINIREGGGFVDLPGIGGSFDVDFDFGFIEDALRPVVDTVADTFEPLVDVVDEGLDIIGEEVVDPALDIAQDVTEPIVDAADEVIDTLGEEVVDPALETAEEFIESIEGPDIDLPDVDLPDLPLDSLFSGLGMAFGRLPSRPSATRTTDSLFKKETEPYKPLKYTRLPMLSGTPARQQPQPRTKIRRIETPTQQPQREDVVDFTSNPFESPFDRKIG